MLQCRRRCIISTYTSTEIAQWIKGMVLGKREVNIISRFIRLKTESRYQNILFLYYAENIFCRVHALVEMVVDSRLPVRSRREADLHRGLLGEDVFPFER